MQNIKSLLWIVVLGVTFASVVVEESVVHGADVTIIANPGSFETIEQAALSEGQVDFWDGDSSDDDACTESFAAVELKRFLPACTGIKENNIALGNCDKLPKKGYVFILGNRRSNPLIETIGVAGSKKGEFTRPDSFRIQAFAQGDRTVCIIEGNTRIGTLYGVYAYLERLGIRFFGLGEQGTAYPPKPGVLITKLDAVENPGYINRGFWAWQVAGNQDFFLWMARNRMNFWQSKQDDIHLLKKLGITLSGGGHDIQKECLPAHGEYPYNHPLFDGDEDKPADPYKASSAEYVGDTNGDGKLDYFEAHPEWFGLRKGKRSDRQIELGVNYCTSNDDATAELARNIVPEIINGKWRHVDCFNFWMVDGGSWCECDNCKAQTQGNKTNAMLHITYLVNKELQKARKAGRLKRDVKLVTLAYGGSARAPTRPLPDDFDYKHICVTFFPIQRCYVHTLWDAKCHEGWGTNKNYYENYKAWATNKNRLYKGEIWMGEYYNISHHQSLPILFTRIMTKEIPFFHRNGTSHFHYMHPMTGLWGTWTLNNYLLARLLWNPDADANAILDEYFSLYYPTTTASTRSFYRHLEDAFSNIMFFKIHWSQRSYRECLKDAMNRSLRAVADSRPQRSYRKCMKDENAALLPWDHFHYERHHPSSNDGPDMVEIVESIGLARKALDQALIQCDDTIEQARLLEDQHRFAYGENMVYYFYYQLRTLIFDQRRNEAMARREFNKMERYAEKLKTFVHRREFGSEALNDKRGSTSNETGNGLRSTCRSPAMHGWLKDKYGQ